jgi:ribosomal protein L16 Arg81 hydroxylase
MTYGMGRVPGAREERPALVRCIGVPAEEFGAEYWGRRPLLSRATDPGRTSKSFEDLITVADVDELIGRRGLRTPFLRMARDGDLLPVSEYAGPGGAGAQVTDQALDERVLAGYADGATLVLQGLHRLWPPLGDFARQLAADLGHPVGVNAYLTPPANQGFDTHYDTHDVFVLQLAGGKHWRIHPPVVRDPLGGQPWQSRTQEITATAHGEPALQTVLEPGDALYLPRGWLHSAQARGELSMHLTVGVYPVTRYALVEALLAYATEEPRLRRSLPLGADATLGDELDETIRTVIDWLSTVDAEGVAERVRTRLWQQSRPDPIRPLAQAAALRTVGPQTRITARGHGPWRLSRDGDDQVVLRVFDRTIRFPGYCEAAVRAALSGEVRQVAELPGLDAADQITLTRRLLREAVVVPLEP